MIFPTKSRNKHFMCGKFALFLAILAVGACAIPSGHGPYYRPIYTDLNAPGNRMKAWTVAPGKSSGPQNRLRFKVDQSCIVELSSIVADDSDFLFSWRLERWGEKLDDRCRYRVSDDGILIEDVERGFRHVSHTVHRIFNGSKPNLSFEAGMAAHAPLFSEIPVEQRTYTVSIPFRLNVNGKIPESISLQLPDIKLGTRLIKTPLLTLNKVDTGGNIRAYVPVNVLPLANADAIRFFGMPAHYYSTSGSFASFHPGVAMWYEEKGEIRLASSFSGRDDINDSLIKPGIWGEILIQVMSGSGIAFPDQKVIWRRDKGELIFQYIDSSRLALTSYTTRPNDVLAYSINDKDVHFIALLPRFRPALARVTLPKMEINGNAWPVRSIDFEFQTGGIGLTAWP